ncbi:MAG: acetyltransferase [Chloroflexi bacterium]|uniref:Acetyltransferase n=1 Tax=Candidatus Chlorohelix allophototropha TaxID=3003348 RepID=A0A8T7M7V3_9CHLR|nr:acetyltransferase [Chloroflexota bacterium]WJW68146.1 acetyltransferase [Chloroflexota bacterium L227-S17]
MLEVQRPLITTKISTFTFVEKLTHEARLPYLPGLEGLRAIAVIAVILYHADLLFIPGGFLGVEIFFVISGYLITSLLLEEVRRTGSANLQMFWFRRARRLLPAVFLLLIATLAFSLIFLPDEVGGIRGDALAATSYITNWYLIFENKSYFELIARPSLLKHLWSLAVEEQFYILFPLLLSFVLIKVRKVLALLILGIGIIGSTLLMAALYIPNIDPSRIYYGTDTRATGLLIGAALAYFWTPWRMQSREDRIPPILLDITGFAAFGGLVFILIWLDESNPFLYQGGFLVTGLLTAILIAVVVHPYNRLATRLLGLSVMRWIGSRSYGIYLWHWPIYMVTRSNLDVSLNGLPLLVVRLVLTCLFAELSYTVVETPIRKGALGNAWKSWREANGIKRRILGWRWKMSLTTFIVFSLALVGAVSAAHPVQTPAYLAETSLKITYPNIINITLPAFTATPLSNYALLPSSTPEAIATFEATQPPQPTHTPLPTATPPATATPEPTPTPEVPLRVTAIGDSVMLGAAKDLGNFIPGLTIDAEVSRQFMRATDILKAYRKEGVLGNLVIIHLGNNGGISDQQFDELMQTLGDIKRVIFVNDKVPRRWEEANNDIIARGVKRYPNTQLVDWFAASNNHPELFWDDGLHLRPEGAKFYAELVISVLRS